MTIVQERLTTEQEGEKMPEVTIGLIDDEYRRHEFISKFGKDAVDALQTFANRRLQAGMGPQHPTIIHPPQPDGKTDYKARELEEL